MKITDYLYDKLYLLITAVITIFLMWVFLTTLEVLVEIRVVVCSVMLFLVLLVLVVEYVRRASYYKQVEKILDEIDQKFLITELLPSPSFIDAQLTQETLAQANKSMTDMIRIHENNINDYVQYIELWIHEIKTPLAALSLIVENRPDDDKKKIQKEIKEIQEYLDQVLYYARISSLEDDTVIQNVALKPLVNEVLRSMSSSFIEKQVKIEVQDIDVNVYADAKWLQFMIRQLVDNAIKYSEPNEGVVKIFAQQHHNSVSLHIVDNGIGIAKHDIGRVFNRGFTGVRGQYHQNATGMGLYLVKSMADKLGMHVSIESDKGTHVSLVIPKSEMYFRESYNNVREM